MKNSGTIFNIQHFSLHDGAGIRTVVFLKGCPLDCIWCHNPESKKSKPEILFSYDKCVGCLKCAQVCNGGCLAKADGILNINRKNCIFCGKCEEVCSFDAISLVGKSYTADEVLDELKKDDIFFGNDGGVTFSGGEPFAQPDFLLTLLKKCKEKGYNICVETSGYANEEAFKECAKYIDTFLFDIKETDNEKHKEFTGKDNGLILKNLEYLEKINANVVLRCHLIPNCNDSLEHFENIGILAQKLSCVKSVELLPYHPLGLNKLKQLGAEAKYNEQEFLKSETAERFADAVRLNTIKSVIVNV